MRYRAEVDGLRALAVLPVILFHAGFEAFDGGFIGVDIFFVISGYLITKLVHDEVDRGSFSLVGFYERRARRILPALFLVCFASVPFAWRWSLPDEFKAFSESVVAVSAFASNFYFWLHSDYFAVPAETTPLHHTWSLAVEEQFYVFYPLTLLALRGAGRRAVFAAILCGSVISLGLAEYGSRTHPSANFYLMPGRAWELGVGALLALADSRFRVWKTGSKQLLSIGGLAAIGLSLAVFDPSTRHPGISTLVPVLGTAALIVCATPDTVVGKLLGSRSLVGIGLVSYSAYLWHQPLFAFARIYSGGVTAPAYLVLIAMTFGLAYLSWRFVEQPFRQKTRYRQSQVFAYAAAASAVLIAFGMAGRLPAGFPGRIENELRMVASWSSDRSPRYRECTSRPGSARGVDNACVYGPSSDPKVAIVGDSHAGAISHRLAQSLAVPGRPLIEFSRTACPPAVGLSIHADKGRGCAEYNDQVRRRLLQDDIDTVVMVARWSQYIHLRPFDNLEGGRVTWTAHASPIDAGDAPMSDEVRIQRVTRLYAESVQELVRHGKRVVLVYPVPEVGWNVPREVMRRMRVAIGKRDALTTSYEVFRQRHADTYAALDSVGDSPNLIRVRPEDVFCNTVVPGRCVADSAGKPYYWDDSHLNESAGAPLVVDQIRRAVKARGWIVGW